MKIYFIIYKPPENQTKKGAWDEIFFCSYGSIYGKGCISRGLFRSGASSKSTTT